MGGFLTLVNDQSREGGKVEILCRCRSGGRVVVAEVVVGIVLVNAVVDTVIGAVLDQVLQVSFPTESLRIRVECFPRDTRGEGIYGSQGRFRVWTRFEGEE